jgi:hypothetical protein
MDLKHGANLSLCDCGITHTLSRAGHAQQKERGVHGTIFFLYSQMIMFESFLVAQRKKGNAGEVSNSMWVQASPLSGLPEGGSSILLK